VRAPDEGSGSGTRRALEAEPDTEVIGAVADPYEARDLIAAHKLEVVTLDICMPRVGGLGFRPFGPGCHPKDPWTCTWWAERFGR
jgi:hypothetical protein